MRKNLLYVLLVVFASIVLGTIVTVDCSEFLNRLEGRWTIHEATEQRNKNREAEERKYP